MGIYQEACDKGRQGLLNLDKDLARLKIEQTMSLLIRYYDIYK
jgi:hypothetical protein